MRRPEEVPRRSYGTTWGGSRRAAKPTWDWWILENPWM